MLADVETFGLFVGTHADTHGNLDDHREDEGGHKGQRGHRKGTDELDTERSGIREDSDGNRAPDTTDTVDRDGTDRIVNFQLVQTNDTEYNQYATDSTEQGCLQSG